MPFPESESENTVTLSFSSPPALNVPVTVSFNVVPQDNLPNADVSLTLVPELQVLSATPGGYTIQGSEIKWSAQSLPLPGPYVYQVQVEAVQNFYNQVVGTVHENVVVGNSDTSVSVRNVKVVGSTASVSDVPSSLADTTSLAETWQQDRLRITLKPSKLPVSGEDLSATIWVTNTMAASPISYAGTFAAPSGWTVLSGATSWSTTLVAGQAESRTLLLHSSGTTGDWAMQLDLTNLSSPSEPSYHVNYFASALASGQGPGSSGTLQSAPAGAYLVGTQPFRYKACQSGAGSPTTEGGILQPAADVTCADCQVCRFTLRGLLTNYGAQQRATLLGLKIIPDEGQTICPGTSLTYWTSNYSAGWALTRA